MFVTHPNFEATLWNIGQHIKLNAAIESCVVHDCNSHRFCLMGSRSALTLIAITSVHIWFRELLSVCNQ
jgi:hypothetical protein